jgi:hypothetical protein
LAGEEQWKSSNQAKIPDKTGTSTSLGALFATCAVRRWTPGTITVGMSFSSSYRDMANGRVFTARNIKH